jgi:uncharacterized protein DUF6059
VPTPKSSDVKKSLRRVLWAIYHILSVFGMIYTVADLTAATTRPLEVTGPGADHPERVPADVPLTPLERALLRELHSG